MRSLVIYLLLTTSALAQDTMTAKEFDEHVTGRTVTFLNELGQDYGVERYMEGQRVMWSDFNGTCQYGIWFESKGDICFRYDGDPQHKCWAVYDSPDGMRATYTTSPPHNTIIEDLDRDTPLICNDLSS